MTPAINTLNKHNIEHRVLKYDHQPCCNAYGLEAVEKLDLEANLVFKTLVLCREKDALVIAIIPVTKKLNLKKIAQVLGVKKVSMATQSTVHRSTGYILGGVSPLGQKKLSLTIIDESALKLEQIYVSAGRRGLEIALCPAQLATLTKAAFQDICQ